MIAPLSLAQAQTAPVSHPIPQSLQNEHAEDLEKLDMLSKRPGKVGEIARKAVVEMRHASGANVKVVANPVRLSETPADYRLPPPTLGQHTEEVLLGLLGIAPEKFAALRKAGVI